MALNHFLQVPLTDAQIQSFAEAQGSLDHIENANRTAIVQCDPTGPNITATVNGATVFQARSAERFAEITEPGLSSIVRCAEDSVETYVGGNLRTQVVANKIVMLDDVGAQRLVVSDQGVIVNNTYALPTTAGAAGTVLTSQGGTDTAFLPFTAAADRITNATDPGTEVSVQTPGFLTASVGVGKICLEASASPGAVSLQAPGTLQPALSLFDTGEAFLSIPGPGQVFNSVLVCGDNFGRATWGIPARIQDPGDPFNSFVWCDSDNINVGTNYPTGQLLLGIQGTIIPGQVLTATSSAGACSWANPPVVNPFNQNLNTSNAVTFGSVSTPTLGAATTNVSGTLQVSSAYTMPTIAGSNGQVIVSNGAGASSWRTPSPGLFSQIAVQTVAATDVETTLLGVGVGTLTIPANSFIVGNAYTYKTGGLFRNNANNTTFRFRLRNSGVLFDSGLLTLPLISALTPWNIDTTFSYTGGTSMVTNFTFTYNNASDARGFTSQQVTTAFNPTISNTLDFTVQWTVANANNTIQTNFGIVSKLY
jgi:hypothetical protein